MMDNGDPTRRNLTMRWFFDRLDEDDDPELWQVALGHILGEFEKELHVLVEVGRCSHWLRPHQCRWPARGGFAWPTGYGSGNGGHSYSSLPQFDWSVVLGRTGSTWEPIKRTSIRHSLRVTIPSRTKRHQQAAVHTVWHTGKEKETVFYGFRKREQSWLCTASEVIT
jgi:hypothetical protein